MDGLLSGVIWWTKMLLDDIERTIKKQGNRVAYVHDERRMSFSVMSGYAEYVAAELAHHGLSRGDRVAVFLEASVEYPAVCVGIWRCGGVVVPLDAALSQTELSYFLSVAETRLLVSPARKGSGPGGLRAINVQCLAGDPSKGTEKDGSGEEDFLLFFSSGTTGPPKGIVHTHRSMSELNRRHIAYSGLHSGDVVLATSLFNTGFGFHSYIHEPLAAGAKVVITHPFLPRHALEAAGREGVTRLVTVPAVLMLLAAVDLDARALLPELKTVRAAAATLDPASRERFYTRFGIQPIQNYGMNELGRIAATSGDASETSERNVGYPEVELQIFDDDGKLLAPGESGEIGVRAPSLCRPFYLTKDGQHQALPMRDGYFMTGDLGRLSVSGDTLELLGRRKSFILTPRYKVDPNEVESVLLRHPLVVEAAVIPAPGYAGYESIKAVVTVSALLSSQDLLAFCSDKLPAGKCPQSITFVDRLPRNKLGKIEVGKLRNL